MRNIDFLYFNGLPSLRESIWTLRQDKPRLSIAIGREMLREPLLNSDEYVVRNDHKSYKDINSSEKLLTLTKICFHSAICEQSVSEVAKKKKNQAGIDPEYLKKQKEALVRRHRQVIYLNDSEMAAIRQYCERFRVGTKAVLFREAIMEKVLSELDDNHPTLF